MGYAEDRGVKRVNQAVAAAIVSMAIPAAVVLVVTMVRETSFSRAIAQPGFWVVEGTVAVVAAFVAYSDRAEASAVGPPPNKWTRVLRHMGWTAAAIALIAVLLSVVLETPIMRIVNSRPFVIGGFIGLAIAVLEAWPSDDKKR